MQAQIIAKFELAKKQITKVITILESDGDWEEMHKRIGMAVRELGQATRLLAIYHLEVCILERHQKLNLPFVNEDVEEITKTYKYLN